MSHNGKKRIVVAEDDEAVMELVSVRLDVAGYQAIPARNGAEALEQVRIANPDGLILDIGLPQMDGFEVLETLRRLNRRLPVLMLTARHSAADVKRAVDLGANGYLAKPFDGKMLIDRVSRMMQPAGAAKGTWAL